MKSNIVITGIGVVSPIGSEKIKFLKSLQEGWSGWGPIGQMDTQGLVVKHACEVDPQILRTRASVMDPFVQYALNAAHQAVKDARISLERWDRHRVGLAVSSSKGGVKTFEHAFHSLTQGKKISMMQAAKAYASLAPNMAAQWIARQLHVRGPAVCPVAACATGVHAIIAGVNMLIDGRADYCLVGASDASLTKTMLAGYQRMGVYATNRLRPYCQTRTGFVIGEGSGILMLETEETAKARGAHIYAYVRAAHWAADAFHPIHFNFNGQTLINMIETLCQQANLKASELDYVNTHGTGTPEGDRYELDQLNRVFANHSQTQFSSIKAMTGHMLGASGAIETIASCLAIRHGFVPPTMHIEKLEPNCHINVTPNKSNAKDIRYAMTYSMGFGGHIGGLILERGDAV